MHFIEILKSLTNDPNLAWCCILLLSVIGFPLSLLIPLIAASLSSHLPPMQIFLIAESALLIVMTIHYWVGRHIREYLLEKYADKLQNLPTASQVSAPFLMLSIRSVPFVPFILQNLLSGALRIPIGWFLLISVVINSLYVSSFVTIGSASMQSNWKLLLLGICLLSLLLLGRKHILRYLPKPWQ